MPLADVTPSPALSQVGGEWPPDGRMVGIVIDPAGDLSGVRELREAIFSADMVPLLIAPHGGMVEDLPVQRTFSTGRSVEYDVLLLAGVPRSGTRRHPGAGVRGGCVQLADGRPAGAA